MAPRPNQTVRIRAVNDMEMNLSFESETPSTSDIPETFKMAARAAFALTQKVGDLDKEGNVVAELTYDEASSEMMMNGQPMRIGDDFNKLIGKKLTATFNNQGDLIDLKIPTDMGLPEESFKEVVKSAYGNLPQTPLAVGEVATSPLDFTIPLPIPGAPPLKIDGQIKSKLLSVENDSTGRTAKFDQTVDGKMVGDLEVPGPTGKIKMSLDFKLNGGGGVAMNVDKGFLKSSDSKMSFSGKLKMAGEPSASKLPTINFQGTIKVTVSGSN
ncbi:MAG: hypothetical protein J2P21_24515 [Chloracidobacterium sp.]|nr:hypothetical protein [Chloracidobacterium sp.]